MPRRLLLALLALVAAPLVLLGWVSTSAMQQSQKQAKDQYVGVLLTRLTEIDRSANKLFNDYARQLAQEMSNNPAESTSTIDQLRRMRRTNPVVRQGVFVSSDGQILFPPRPSADNAEAMTLFAALPGMVSGRPDSALTNPDWDQLSIQVGNNPPTNQSSNNQTPQQAKIAASKIAAGKSLKPQAMVRGGRKVDASSLQQAPLQSNDESLNDMGATVDVRFSGKQHWQVWYMDRGTQLILWLSRNDGAAVGIILERPRWTSDLTALLPDSDSTTMDSATNKSVGFTALVDERKQTVYRWGDEGERTDHPVVALAMSAPLTTWQWEFHGDQAVVGQFSSLPMIASLFGIGLILLSLGAYVLTSVGRQMRAARNRVSFAGQVSHELRTPLTNIRLYAELAESDLDQLPDSETRESIERRLSVIDNESKRLGRLVSGVLEMIRSGSKERGPRMSVAIPDQLIDETLEHFAPSFQNAGIDVTVEPGAAEAVQMDTDIFEMVLVNLLSNVEKYAASGKSVTIRSELASCELVVSVADQGPGISRRHRSTIFKPFARLDDSINAPSGTGIGLTIARKAAIRHGGRLELIPTGQGSCFQLRIPVTPVSPSSPSSTSATSL